MYMRDISGGGRMPTRGIPTFENAPRLPTHQPRPGWGREGGVRQNVVTPLVGVRASLLSILGGLLLLLQLLVPSMALASSTKSLPALTSQGVLDLAGVSVVRLEISYRLTRPAITVIQCTALGTLIASWPATNPTEQNNWVLTDSSVLDPNAGAGSCVPGSLLSAITIFASSEFTNHMSAFTMLDQLTCQTGACSDQPAGSSKPIAETITKPVNGGILFSFHSDAAHTLPYLALAQPSSSTSPNGIELANAGGTWPATPKITNTTATLQDFLDPTLATATAGIPSAGGSAPLPNEPGMPIVDSNGQVMGIQLSGSGNQLQIANIQNLEQQVAELTPPLLSTHLAQNTLTAQWDTGITQYEQKNYPYAANILASIENVNPSFQAPKAFAQLARTHLPQGPTGSPSASSSPGTGQGSSNFLGIPNWLVLLVGLIAGLIVLILLFVLVSLTFGRERALHKRTQVQTNISTRKISLASLLALFRAQWRRINALLNRRKQPPAVIQQTPSVKERQPQIYPQPVPTAPNIPCPNCGQSVRPGATFCPNCRYALSPGTSIARQVAQTLPVTEPPAPDRVPTPPNRSDPQPAQVEQNDVAIQATLHRLWDRAEN